MEEQLAELAAQVAALEAASGGGVTNTMFAETFYYLTIPLMIIIHAGFLAYEMGASRLKNVLSSGVKNILAFAFMIPTFYFFGGGSIGVSQRASPVQQVLRAFPALNTQMRSHGVGVIALNTWGQTLPTMHPACSLAHSHCLPQQQLRLCRVL